MSNRHHGQQAAFDIADAQGSAPDIRVQTRETLMETSERLSKQVPLVERIRKGQTLLWERWQLIKSLPDGEEREQHQKAWDDGVGRLKYLHQDLMATGWRACLYDPPLPAPGNPCMVCTVPNDQWRKENCPGWGLEW